MQPALVVHRPSPASLPPGPTATEHAALQAGHVALQTEQAALQAEHTALRAALQAEHGAAGLAYWLTFLRPLHPSRAQQVVEALGLLAETAPLYPGAAEPRRPLAGPRRSATGAPRTDPD